MFSLTLNTSHLFTVIITLFLEIVIGILGNGFIALVNIMEWVKRRKISSVDQILTALALTRFSLVWSLLICILLLILYPHFFMTSAMLTAMVIIWIVNNHFSIWLATCLSVFYLLKIANFCNSFFLYLKWRVKKVVLVILVISLILLILNIVVTMMYYHYQIDVYEGNISYSLMDSPQFLRGLLFNNSSKVLLATNSSHVLLPINSIFMFIPFTVSLAAFLMLIFSLWKHHRKMQLNAKQLRDASTMAHLKALQTGLSFMLLYAIYLLFIVIGTSSLGLVRGAMILLLDHVSGVTFPISHSLVLILGNSKLRQATLSVLWCMRCKSKEVDTMGP